MVKCQVCGEEVGDEEFCPICGYKIPIKKEEPLTDDFDDFTYRHNKICPNCGYELYINAVVCPRCGIMVGNSSRIFNQDKNQAIAIVLSFLVAGAGQLYLGFHKKGVILFLSSYVLMPILAFIALLFMFLLQSYILGPLIFLFAVLISALVWAYSLYDVFVSSEALKKGEYVEDRLFGF